MRHGKNEDDIFDYIMKCKAFKPIYPIYAKHKVELLYLFFGGLTFLLAVLIYVMLEKILGFHVLAANILSWLSGVTFSFFTTRKWVFHSDTGGIEALLSQMGEFYLARIATLLLQEFLLFVFVTLLTCNSLIVKICTEIINIILNYIFSKFIIFKER